VGGGFAELVTGLPPSTFAFVLRRSTSFLRLAFYPSFTDCAGISRLMAKRAQLACPVVGRRTRFQPDQTAWNAAEEREHLPPPQSLTQNRGTLGVNAVNLKNMLG
jgi:hypothetical protein